ncbi:MAG: hypothetical protein IAE79_02305 [Anaerolinea sp.]|nr:hypothetical protein [Anaerolinea sp.]
MNTSSGLVRILIMFFLAFVIIAVAIFVRMLAANFPDYSTIIYGGAALLITGGFPYFYKFWRRMAVKKA